MVKSIGDESIREEIILHAARAFFASAWADWADEYGPGTAGHGVDIMDEMPEELDISAISAANELVKELEQNHKMALSEIFAKAVEISKLDNSGDRPRTPEMFGHYAAMQSMGHGVSLYDALGKAASDYVDVPYKEFSCFDLDDKKYPIAPKIRGT